jgi:Domain of unknown function (DUF4252)
MRKVFVILLLSCAIGLHGQSKSITRFRSDFKENTNMFFYSSTLKMLNADNNPEIADLLKDIEEIRVLNYEKEKQDFTHDDIVNLQQALKEEDYVNLMSMKENGSAINLYSHEKRGKTVGFVAMVENKESLILIDLTGSIDVKKFLELKQKLDSRMGDRS